MKRRPWTALRHRDICLDRGYDSAATLWPRDDIDDVVCAKNRRRGASDPGPFPSGLRWPVERTNSWLSNYGQLRRNTDRKVAHRLTQLALAVILLITAKLIDWRNAAQQDVSPIR